MPSERTTRKAQLPSKGLPYGSKVPKGEMDVYMIRAKDAKLVLGSGSRALEAISLLLSRCIASPQIDPNELTSSDRMYLLLLLRILSYGPIYEFPVTCPSCELSFRHQVDLNSFDTKELDSSFVEPFEFKLPMSGQTVGLRLIRGSDEAEIQHEVEQQFRHGPQIGDSESLLRVVHQVVTVDGVAIENRDRLEWVEELIAGDFEAIRNKVSAMDSGVIADVQVTCGRCSKTMLFYLPFGPGFFRTTEGRPEGDAGRKRS